MKKTKVKKGYKNIKENKAITLIALVITIIVLLILAGVSIATLTGENGILTQASNAKKGNIIGEEKDQIAIAYNGAKVKNLGKGVTAKDLNEQFATNGVKAEANGEGTIKIEFEKTGNIYTVSGTTGIVSEIEPLETTEETKPYYPGEGFFQVDGTDLNNGLVISDGTNYWTWIEVPRTTTIYDTATLELEANDEGLYTSEECLRIEEDLISYVETLLSGNSYYNSREGYTDQWYDRFGAIYNEELEYVEVVSEGSEKIEEFKTYYGTLYEDETLTTEAEEIWTWSSYYIKREDLNLEDREGCGLTYNEYNNLKKKMLSSIYTNGGFWIGQYEMGAKEQVVENDNGARTPICQKGAIAYNYVTCSQAQRVASSINSGNRTSSLLFGIQFDLVLKHLQTKGATVDELTLDSTTWGNYWHSEFEIENGKFIIYPYTAGSYKNYTETLEGSVENKIKLQEEGVLLTTGASSRNSKMNIYDFAGNVGEFTLEKSAEWGDLGVNRDTSCAYLGTQRTAHSSLL